MLHKGKVAIAMWGNAKRQLRIALGRKPRTKVWPPNGVDATRQHHSQLVRRFLKEVPKNWDVRDKYVCEVGGRDCLAIPSLIIGMGARKVEMVEPFPADCFTRNQIKIIEAIKAEGHPLDTSVLTDNGEVRLDQERIFLRSCFMEKIPISDAYDFIYSFHVLEHVEDLEGFYSACHKVLKPGGQMFHCIDFSGHSELEDPVPPLDHQTYPDWIYDLMYPPYYRQTRFFLSDHTKAMVKAGLIIDEIRPTRTAEAGYVKEIRPKLREAAKAIPNDEIAVLEAVVVSHKD